MATEDEGDRVSEEARSAAWRVVDDIGLPKGLARRVLEEHGVDNATVEGIVSNLVPYSHE